MSSQLGCPELECWQALLDVSLSPEEQERYERHLESCPACQQRLDQADECADALVLLAREVGDPTMGPVDPILTQIRARLHEEKFTLPTDQTGAVDLYFLHPAERSDILGMLGAYEVMEVIGQGGMGVVLKAFDPALHRLVAIKVMAAAVAGSATARQRFTREAKAAAAVCHEHIVTVHGVFERDGLPYLVMQYVAGESLQTRLDRTGPLEVVEIVRIGLQTASGLAAAHAQGLIHRDIKPANLLLENGLARVRITDFGLARMADDVQLTQNGVVAGTPEYMAPEQARGETVDHRADLFSLGSVLYALCTGGPPFRGSTALAVLHQVNEQAPKAIRELHPEVPVWLEAMIARLMAKNPADRFSSAAEVVDLLQGYLAHLQQPEAIPAPELPASLLGLQTTGAGDQETEVPVPSPCLPIARFPYLFQSPRFLVSFFLVVLGFIALGVPIVLFAAKNLGQLGQQAGTNPKAGNLLDGPCDVWSIAISQDGKVVASGAGMWNQPGEIGVWDLGTRKPLQRFSEEQGVASVAFSPNGKLLASGSWSGHVRMRDWVAGKEVADFEVPGVARVAFSPNGEFLATATEGKTVQLWDVAQRKLATDLEGDLFRFQCVAFSPNGKRILAGGGDWKIGGLSQVNIWDTASKQQLLKLTGHQNTILGIVYSPDGKTIATASVDRTIRLWDADSGQTLKILQGHTNSVEGVVFSADGRTLVSASQDRTIRFWDVDHGQEKGQIVMPVPMRTVSFTPDGNTLIAGGAQKTLKFFDAASHKEVGVLWNGADPQRVAMDDLPMDAPQNGGSSGWWVAAELLGLGLALTVLLLLGIWLYALQRRRPKEILADFPPEGKPVVAETIAPPISFSCAACGKNLKAKSDLAGKKVKCFQCGQAVLVPGTRMDEAGRISL